MTNDDSDDTVTEADLKEAQERWADPKHVPLGTELFSRPVYGDGFRGDVPIEKAPAAHAEPFAGFSEAWKAYLNAPS